MEKYVLVCFICFICIITKCTSQDLLTKKNGEDIKTKIIEVNKINVIYKKFDNLNGPNYSLPIADILLIRYENGTKDIFSNEFKPINEKSILDADRDSMNGVNDAIKFYKYAPNAGAGTFLTSILFTPFIGLIPAICCSVTPVKKSNLGIPNSVIIENPNYYNGYKKKARSMKVQAAWKNFGIAFGIYLIAIPIIIFLK